jgi:hypothetical protein
LSMIMIMKPLLLLKSSSICLTLGTEKLGVICQVIMLQMKPFSFFFCLCWKKLSCNCFIFFWQSVL